MSVYTSDYTGAEIDALLAEVDAASATPAADIIPKADSDGLLDIRWVGLPLEAAGAYGVRWNPNDDTYMEVGASNGNPVQDDMKRVLLKDADATIDTGLASNGYLNPTDSTEFEDESDASGHINGANDHQVVVEIPRCYTQVSVDERGHHWYLACDKPLPGLSLDPAFLVGVGGPSITRNHRYVGAYQSVWFDDSEGASGAYVDATGATRPANLSNDHVGSVSGFKPLTHQYRSQFRTLTSNIGGAGVFWQWDYWLVRLLQILYLTDGPIRSSNQPWNSRANIPGHTEESGWDYAHVQTNGLTNSLGNASGSIAGTLATGGAGNLANSFRGIENFFGSVWNWYDGLNVNNYMPFACFDPTDFADDTETNNSRIVDQFGNPITMPATSDRYQKLHWAGTLLPSQVDGGADASSYITDNYWAVSGWRTARLGGILSSGPMAGFACLRVDGDSSSSNDSYGSRLGA